MSKDRVLWIPSSSFLHQHQRKRLSRRSSSESSNSSPYCRWRSVCSSRAGFFLMRYLYTETTPSSHFLFLFHGEGRQGGWRGLISLCLHSCCIWGGEDCKRRWCCSSKESRFVCSRFNSARCTRSFIRNLVCFTLSSSSRFCRSTRWSFDESWCWCCGGALDAWERNCE